MTGLTAVVNRYPHTAALLSTALDAGDGTRVDVVPPDDVGGVLSAVSRMLSEVDDLDFDVCELPLVNYLAARERGARFTAVPVFLTRRFPHPTIAVNHAAGIEKPADLDGRRIGVSYYGNTDATWARGLLAELGVDLSSVTWVTGFGEQVAGSPVPPGTLHLPRADLFRMLERGELAGLIVSHTQSVPGPDLGPLLPDPAAAQQEWYERTGVFPPLHTVVVKDDVLAAHPGLARALVEAFERAKTDALVAPLAEADRAAARASGFPDGSRPWLGRDPLPYGLGPNEAALSLLCTMAAEQGMLAAAPEPADLFVTAD